MRHSADFDATTSGSRQGCDLAVVYAARRADGRRLVGYIVSRAVGNSVTRHQVTRRLRAIMATNLLTIPTGTGVVIRALPAAAGCRFEALDQAVTRSVGRAVAKAHLP